MSTWMDTFGEKIGDFHCQPWAQLRPYVHTIHTCMHTYNTYVTYVHTIHTCSTDTCTCRNTRSHISYLRHPPYIQYNININDSRYTACAIHTPRASAWAMPKCGTFLAQSGLKWSVRQILPPLHHNMCKV